MKTHVAHLISLAVFMLLVVPLVSMAASDMYVQIFAASNKTLQGKLLEAVMTLCLALGLLYKAWKGLMCLAKPAPSHH